MISAVTVTQEQLRQPDSGSLGIESYDDVSCVTEQLTIKVKPTALIEIG